MTSLSLFFYSAITTAIAVTILAIWASSKLGRTSGLHLIDGSEPVTTVLVRTNTIAQRSIWLGLGILWTGITILGWLWATEDGEIGTPLGEGLDFEFVLGPGIITVISLVMALQGECSLVIDRRSGLLSWKERSRFFGDKSWQTKFSQVTNIYQEGWKVDLDVASEMKQISDSDSFNQNDAYLLAKTVADAVGVTVTQK